MNSSNKKYPQWQRRHESVLLWFLQYPSSTLEECSKSTGYSTYHLSRIVNSPEFKHRYRSNMEIVTRDIIKKRLNKKINYR